MFLLFFFLNPKDVKSRLLFSSLCYILHEKQGSLMPFVIWPEDWEKLLNKGQVAQRVTYEVLAEMQHLAPEKTHQHPSAVIAIALERTTKTDANMKIQR